jgi:hypothetical protein
MYIISFSLLEWANSAHKFAPANTRVTCHIETESLLITTISSDHTADHTVLSLEISFSHVTKVERKNIHILTCRPTAKYQLCKQAIVKQPLPGNTSVDTLFPYVYDYITKLRRRQAEVIQNRENEHVPSIGQGEARRKKYKWLKLGGGQTYDRSSD